MQFLRSYGVIIVHEKYKSTKHPLHCHLFVMKNFANFISDNKMDPSTQNALSQLCKLYAVHGIVENMGEFMQV
jgi:hypothetical protein